LLLLKLRNVIIGEDYCWEGMGGSKYNGDLEKVKIMKENKNPYPTIGEAAKILGITKRQLDHLYMAGLTPAVRRDKLGRRRYPPNVHKSVMSHT
jgi:MerR family regulatory protein